MKNTQRIFVCVCAISLFYGYLFHIPAAAQENSDEALKKQYASIIGEYEFDMTELGGDVQELTFHVKDGNFWVDSGDGDPATMDPVEGAEFEFKAVSSDGQEFEISFLKDDQGEYTKCQILIVAMGMEITGTKIK